MSRFDGMSILDVIYSCGSFRPTWPPVGLHKFVYTTREEVEAEQKNYDECMAELQRRRTEQATTTIRNHIITGDLS